MIASLAARDELVARVVRRLGRDADSGVTPPLAVSGLWGSSAPMLAAMIARQSARPLLYISAHAEQADDAIEDMETFVGLRGDALPAWELRPGEGAAGDEIAAERARLCGEYRAAAVPRIVVAPVQALMQPVPTPAALERNAITLRVGQTIDPNQIVAWLADRGFARLDQVEQAGDFALRGGILDVFHSAAVDPLRFEFFGDEIESIRTFNVSTMRSSGELNEVRISLPPRLADGEQAAQARGADSDTRNEEWVASFFDYLPSDVIVVIHEPADVQEMGRTLKERLGRPASMFDVGAVFERAAAHRVVYLSRFESAAADAEHSFAAQTQSLPPFDTHAADAVLQLFELAREHRVVVYCENEGERQRLRELIEQVAQAGAAPAPAIDIEIGLIRAGFTWGPPPISLGGTGPGAAGLLECDEKSDLPADSARSGGAPHHQTADAPVPSTLAPSRSPEGGGSRFSVVGHHELFHRFQRRRRLRQVTAARPIESFLDLKAGDFVVHALHGIAKFMGMKTLQKTHGSKTEEYLALQFADEAVLHVPANQIDLVQKYVGPGAAAPKLSTLGGTRWKSARARVEEAVTDFAGELLRIQAEREAREGIAYPADTPWQREFEAAFLFNETPDQLRAAGEIKSDMARPRPMDRLLCGDVGYGKTELAIRAAFKAAEYGRQVAVLVPTTVLAEQHYETFRERMAEYPFTVERLSRFRSAAEQRQIVDRVRKGHVDILIGTHRILSRDVQFSDLGLVIIDEEQRFGVEHKELLKHLRTMVDVLTLTATPIPRTLHMSMVGLRDISALETPPLDRRSIVTRVTAWSDALVREAVLRELNRDGQVYFVHNRVASIHRMAARLGRIVPEARIVVGHGQMPGDELEDVMVRFVRRQADVLLCTTIIESGIDIPTANTILINRADMFGLADLHQLRGRVGRYKHRAHCYLLLSPDRPLTSNAARRLKAIEEYSDLGSGFRIAMRDLEIRGAGNVLGPEQSGHIAAVGYEMYCRLLEQAVRRMKGLPPDEPPDVHLELNVEAHVPKSYIPSERQRMEVYRRITACRTLADVELAERDIADAHGKLPPQVETLLALADLRIRAAVWKVRSIVRRDPDLIFTVDDVPRADVLFRGATGRVRFMDARTIYWRVPDNYFSHPTLLAVLRKLFAKPAPVEAKSA
ncbi:MAG: transcription-repair coupling factor [Phycisphaerae bacterium]|nr:transcription-repair coupling factor [Phycisphaerae bacterium]